MTKTLSIFLMLLAAVLFAACGDDHGADGHGDGQEHHDDHDGHDHDGDDHDDHGDEEKVDVGTAKIGGLTVSLGVFGEVEAGHEAVLDIEIEGGTASTVRAWVGVATGRGSLKGHIEGKDGDHHGHVEVPAKLPAGSAIWIELEAADGTKSQGSFSIPK